MNGLRRVGLALALAILAGSAGAQTVQTYTNTQAGPGLRPLGFPVPQPVASLTPIEGFRDYASLHARLQSLALASPDIAAHGVGQTHAGRQVWAYVLGSPESVDREGRAKPAFFINATTHAREWGIPEVSTGLVERMAEGANDGGLVRYLLDNSRLVIIPVQNIDGFLQTQRFPSQVVVGQDPRSPNDWPRDGRMRRKNMRGVDEVLTSFGDHLLGVDLNRNHPPFWGTVTNGGQLTNPNDLTFRGPAAQSEPEVQALLAAAALAPVSRIRLGIDAHSYSKVFFSSNTGRTRLNAIQSRLLSALSAHHADVPTASGAPNGKFYVDVRDPPNSGIGTAAEYFAYQWLVPSWTLEIEPGDFAAQEYGGTADSHGGFVLPESQARRVREAWAESHLVAFYFMAGPPHLARVRLFDAFSGTLLQEQRWEYRAGSLDREKVLESFAPLRPGQQVRVELAFSKPMRHRVGGQIAPLPGASSALPPQVWFNRDGQQTALDTATGEWLQEGWRYGDDSFSFEASLPDQPGEFGLDVRTTDMVGLQLDANPASPVDWTAGAWSGWNSSLDPASIGDIGGTDASLRFASVEGVAGQLPTIVGYGSEVVGEGDRLSVRLLLDAPATSAVIARGVQQDSAAVTWAVGEQGERVLVLDVPEDVEVQGERPWQPTVIVQSGVPVMTSPLAGAPIRLLDNDWPNRAVVASPRNLAAALQMLDGATAWQRELVLEGGAVYALAAVEGRLQTLEVTEPLIVHGNAATLLLTEHSVAAPAIRVASGAMLELDQVAFRASSTLPAVGSSAALPRLVDNAGFTQVWRSSVAGLDGVGGSLFGGGGILRIERTSIVDVTSISPLDVTGSFTLRASSLIGNRFGNNLLASGSAAMASSSSLIGNATSGFRFSAAGEDAALLLVGNLIQRNGSTPLVDPPSPDCGPGIMSAGSNIYSGNGCPTLNAIGDRRGIDLGYVAATGGSAWLPPLGDAVDAGGSSCGPHDQRGAPRPQSLVPTGLPQCDAGAIELGVNPYRGIWQPERDGHGVDLQTAGTQLLLAWYTYDDDGQPTAYQAVAPLTGPTWRAELQRSRRDPASGAVLAPVRVGEVGIDFASDVEATLRWRFDARGVDGSESIRAFPFAPGEPQVEVTGLWFPPAESGYGATITRRGEVTAVGLYYYDASGALRWALGTGSGESVDDIAMLSYTGFCPDCSEQTMPVQSQPAGRLLYHFLTPRRARIDTDLSYPGAAGGQWQRLNADFVPLNDPVDNREAVAAFED